MAKLIHRIKSLHKFLLALCVAVVVALTMTVISVVMYVTSGVSSIDLSRPGFEQVRKDLKESDATPTFDPTGPLNSAVVDQFIQTFNGQSTETRSFGGFNDTAIDDGSIGLTPTDPNQSNTSP